MTKLIKMNFIAIFKKEALRLLIKLEFAIFLFFIIIVYGLIGSILEQDQIKQYYIDKYGTKWITSNFTFADLIFKLDLSHVFSNPIFYFFLFLLSLSLITCSLKTQLSIFLFSRSSKFFNIKRLLKVELSEKLFLKENTLFLNFLSFKNYLTVQKRGIFYSYKGLIGRFSPLLVHLGLIISILGASCSVLGRFSSQEIISKTEIFSIQNITQKGKFTSLPNHSLRMNDFWIIYNKKDAIKQYYSNISILDFNGVEIKNETISVNHPLNYKGLKIYQTDWDLFGLRISDLNFSGSYGIKQFPLKPLKNSLKSWISEIQINDKKIYLLFEKLNNYILLYDENGNFINSYDMFEKISNLEIVESIPRSGFQLKMDPGISILYFGFFIILSSIFLTNQGFSEFWMLKTTDMDEKNLIVIGKTNRSQLNFNLEFFKIFKSIRLKKSSLIKN